MTRRSVLVLFLCAACAYPQGVSGKRALRPSDSDAWRSIYNATLSRDGKYAAWAEFPQEGDGELVVRELKSGKAIRENAGELPPPPLPNPEATEPPPPRGVKVRFSFDGRFVVSSTFPRQAEKEQARKEKKKPEERPKGGLLIVDLESGAVSRVANVKSYALPDHGESWLAYSVEAPPAAKSEEKDKASNGTAGKKPEYGTELVVRNLRMPAESARRVADVSEYAFARDGKTLAYAVASKQEETNGVYTLTPGGEPAALARGAGKYSKLTWDRAGERLAFLSDHEAPGAKPPKLAAYLWERGTGTAATAVTAASQGLPTGWVIGAEGTLGFSRNGTKLYVGTAPAPAPEEKDENADPDEKVVADLWSWKDDYVQPMQRVRAKRERTRTYVGVYDIASQRFLQIGGGDLPGVASSDDGRFAIGSDDRTYRRMVDFDGSYADYYLVDQSTGLRTKVVAKERSGSGAFAWAPDGQHAVFFRERQWYAVSAPSGDVVNLTAKLPVAFYNEEEDVPAEPESYGSGGWTRDGKWVLLYDRFDVWQVSPDGATARNLTAGYGRQHKIEFRVVHFPGEDDDEEVRGLDPSRPVLLRAENVETRESGFWRTPLGAQAAPVKLVMTAKSLRTLVKAKDAETVLFTASTFREFPDLQVSPGGDFREAQTISHANPQQAGLLWGTGELIRFRNADGVPLQAALYKPENFDAKKKYPLIVYLYEKLSQNVNSFVEPHPGHSINFASYVSNGYLVLTPDIVYTEGYPGQSALKCVLPAVDAVVAQGFVDEKAIGIQGHSWGGYQTAYIVSHSTRFRAAEAGAPVGNMTSAYNGIRWGSGQPRQFQYEKTQSRIGGTLWEYPLRYLENSPVFSADRIQTPLLILHDDNDDAVPWYQGIEFFLSLRRLGKEAYLFNYNGEFHGLRRRADQKDFSVRMQQFFDHFLKGAAEPEWMVRGIPYVEREREKEKFQKAVTDR